MIKNYIKIAIRYFFKDKIFASINIVGFIFSICFALLLLIWIMDELSFEKKFNDSYRIFRVVEIVKQNDEIVKRANTYMPLAEALGNNFPFIENSTFIKYESVYALQYGVKNFECLSAYIDSSFFKIFNYAFLEGSAKNLFQQPNGILLSKETSEKIFGNEKALGKEIVHNWFGEKFVFTVAGVIDQYKNTHQKFDVLFSINGGSHNQVSKMFTGNWTKAENFNTYIKIKKGYSISDEEKVKLADFLKNFKNTTSRLWFQPILDIHLHQDFDYYYDNNRGSYKMVLLYSILAVLLLLIAVFNFINLNMARITNRYKEIAIRKIQGATSFSISIQFFTEMVFQSILAVYIALIFTELARPVFNNIIGKDLHIHYNTEFFLYLLMLGIILGFLSALYPAVFLSNLSPMCIFAQRNPKSANQTVVRILSILQFAAAAAMLVIGMGIQDQLNYIQNKDIGIEKENILTLETGLWYEAEAFQQEIERNPNVIASTAVMNNPVDFYWTNKDVKWDGIEQGVKMTEVFVDNGFLDTYKPELIQGEFLYSDFNKYWEKDSASISIPTVINQRAKQLIGKDDVIGTRLNDDYVIIGVVKDFHFHSLHDEIQPMFMSYNPESIFEIDIRISPNNKQETISFLKETYLKYRPERIFDYQFFDDLLDQKYQNEKRLSQIIFTFIIFCMIISILGVIGLSVLETKKRTKEIAIRKVNGASSLEIILLIAKQYIINLFIAFTLGGIAANYFIKKWLLNFAYKIDLEILNYAVPFIIIGLATFITVYIIISRASNSNPVESLRYE